MKDEHSDKRKYADLKITPKEWKELDDWHEEMEKERVKFEEKIKAEKSI